MNAPHLHRPLAALLLGLLAAQANGGAVTVNVSTRTGAAAADAVVVFYPLDGAPAATRDTAVIDQINKNFVPRVSVPIALRRGSGRKIDEHRRRACGCMQRAETF